MKKQIPINVERDGMSKCIPAVYFKQGCYNILKDDMFKYGGHKKHACTGILEIYEDAEDTASHKEGLC